MGLQTPWDEADHVITYTEGFLGVSTHRHGGLLVSERLAGKYLSQAACDRAIYCEGYFGFEEDCAFLIPLFESTALRLWYLSRDGFLSGKTSDEINTFLLKEVYSYFPDYIEERGIDVPEGLQENPK